MSEEDAKAFLKKLGEDKELQEKTKASDSIEKFLAVAKGDGFDFTKEECISLLQPGEGELPDNDLQDDAGGNLRALFFTCMNLCKNVHR